MNLNLDEMVKTETEADVTVNMPVETTTEPTLTENTSETPAAQTTPAPVIVKHDIDIVSFLPWFEENKENFGEAISLVKAKARRVAADGDLIITIPHPDGGLVDNEPARKFIIIDKIKDVPSLNLKAVAMTAFNHNLFRIVYATAAENVFIKYYGVNAKQIVFCKAVGDLMVPYATEKIKKSANGIDMKLYKGNMEEKLNAPINIEDVILRYKQIDKYKAGLVTIKDVVAFFQNRIEGIVDVNHLLQIDNAIISIVG